jgi:AcrR family transcriptional regulator
MPEAHPPDPKRRSERARRAILRSAMKLCVELGYANLSIDAIARDAGVGKQTIYRWWPSKGAVVADAVFAEALPRVRLSPSGDFEQDLRQQLRSTAELMSEPAFGPRIAELLGEAQLDPALARHIAEHLVRPLRDRNRGHLREAQSKGILRKGVDPELAADLLFGPLWLRLLVTKAPISAGYADALVDTVLAGLRRK